MMFENLLSLEHAFFMNAEEIINHFVKNGFSVFEGAPLKTLKLVWQIFFEIIFQHLRKIICLSFVNFVHTNALILSSHVIFFTVKCSKIKVTPDFHPLKV